MKIIIFIFSFLITASLLQSCKGKYYRISSGAMAETLPVGSRVYVTESNTFKNDDIAAFRFYGDDYTKPPDHEGNFEKKWEKWIKRIIASSGDKIELRHGNVYLNDELIRDPVESLQSYTVKSKVLIEDFPERNEEFSNASSKGDTLIYAVQLTLKEAEDYRNRKPAILSVEKIIDTSYNQHLAQPCDCNYSIDNYGPVKIPSVGDTIEVNAFNIRFYQNIPNIEKGTFVVKENLYFLLGDNRHGSMDSRYIGVISHSNMVGIVK